MSTYAFLLVHGIGDFSAGGAVANAAQSLQKRFSNLERLEESHDAAAGTHSCDFQAAGSRVRLTEYHWSGTFGKLRRLNPLQTLWRVFQLFYALPSLGAYGPSHPVQRRLAVFGGWALLVSAIALTFGNVALVAAFAMGSPDGNAANPTLENAALNTILLAYAVPLVAVAAGLMMYLLSLRSAGRHSGRAAQWLGLVLGSILLFAYSFIVFFAATILALLIWETGSVGLVLLGLAVLGVPLALSMWLLLTIVDLLRDVVTYLAPGKDGSDNTATSSIKREVASALDRLLADGFEDVTLVAHSLGTVIAAEVLLSWTPAAGTRPRIRLITCGSPLRRFIAPLLPNRRVEPNDVLGRLAARGAFELVEWVNLYRVLDLVGQRLFRGKPAMTDLAPSTTDRLLRPWHTAPYGHSNYWADPRFLDRIVATVLGRA